VKRYNPKDIEPRWQQVWDETKLYRADLKSSKPKYIAMSMFNYPSGAGIHIGHAMNYTISDVKARFKRQQGYESYHPVGWDAFGLPAENYAIKSGVSPQESMATIIPMYHKQYKAMGWSNDWSKEIATHQPRYYKWTQWIFLQMRKHGLAYQDARLQWWCPIDKTVLANEQVIDGKCWRHDGPDDPPAEKKEIKQWFFKITDYADELLDAIDELDWTESVKLAQRNWIGKSEGAEVEFRLEGAEDSVKVFTTRPDTIFGATFLVIAPEHKILNKLSISDESKAYVKIAENKSELDRQESKEKTGVRLDGISAINPANQERLPVFVADYVLPGYGTGAIMAVPAHDERDHEFAEKFGLMIRQVIEKPKDFEGVYTGEGELINSGKYDGLESSEAREKIVADLAAEGIAEEKVNYKMRDWSVSRQRYWGAPIPVIHCQKCGPVLVPEADLPVVLPELSNYEPMGDGRSALARAEDWLKVDCPQCGGPGQRETDTMDTYVDSSWYMYRYFDPHDDNQAFDSDIVKKWEPVDFYNGADHATAHLLYARFFGHFFKKIGLVAEPEPFKKFLFNGKVTAADGRMFSKSKGNGVDPLEIIDSGYGADALRTYLMFAAPLDQWVRWDPQGVPGAHRFLSRLWNITQEFLDTAETGGDNKLVLSFAHRAIKKVTEDLENQKYNTAIAAMMKLTNDLYLEKAKNGFSGSADWRFALESLTQLVAPFAPYIAEELWHDLGYEDSVNKDNWPQWDERLVKEEVITLAVQINGKVRSEIVVAADISAEDAIAAAKADEKIAAQIAGKVIKKEIYVPGRLVSLVI
jgi:leucyl-tRNA synthetase